MGIGVPGVAASGAGVAGVAASGTGVPGVAAPGDVLGAPLLRVPFELSVLPAAFGSSRRGRVEFVPVGLVGSVGPIGLVVGPELLPLAPGVLPGV